MALLLKRNWIVEVMEQRFDLIKLYLEAKNGMR
jgi:hypothetical protein